MKRILYFLWLVIFITEKAEAQWQIKSTLTNARRQHNAVAHPNGKIYAWGGWSGTTLLSSVNVYNPQTNTWASGTASPLAARGSSFALGDDNFIYQISGHASTGKTTACYRYAPGMNTWSLLAPITNAVWEGSAVSYNNKIYVFGGEAVISGNALSSDYVQIYNTATNTWSMGTAMPGSRMQHEAVRVGNNVYIFGGRTSVSATLSVLATTIYKFDLVAGTWSTLTTSMPAGEKNSFGAAAGPDGKIYLTGGRDNIANDASPSFSTVNVFDPTTDLFLANSFALPQALAENVLVATQEGVYSMGGTNGVAMNVNYFLNPCSVSISYSSPSAICPGTSVTLTASTGTSYSWSTGATTQSISVTTPGTYSVLVNGTPACNTITLTDNSLSGTYPVGQGYTFETISEAAEAYNTHCLNGPVIFELKDASYNAETMPIVFTANSSSSATNTLTVRPASGVNTVLSSGITNPLASTSVIKLADADYIILDGSNDQTNSRNWTIRNPLTTTRSAVVWLASNSTSGGILGCLNNTIKNLNIIGSITNSTASSLCYGVLSSFNNTNLNSTCKNNNSNLIANNFITAVSHGITFFGDHAAGTGNSNNTITENVIGPEDLSNGDHIRRVGISVYAQNQCTISKNEIRNVGVLVNESYTAADRFGILIENTEAWPNSSGSSCENSSILSNIIHDIFDEKAQSAVGLNYYGWTNPCNNVLANNVIYNIRSNANSSNQTIGMGITAGRNDKVVFNSIHLFGDMDPAGTATMTGNVCGIRLNGSSTTNFMMANNVLNMDVSSNNNALLHYGLMFPSASYSWGTGFSDYNDWYINSSNTQLRFGAFQSSASAIVALSTVSDLNTWGTSFTPAQEVHSIALDPLYINDENLEPSNSSPLIGAGVAGTGIVTDINTKTRSTIHPTIGAYEICIDYQDSDGDGYGNPAVSQSGLCDNPTPGFVNVSGDCNDNNNQIHPGSVEICNGLDDNCNGQIDEGLTFVTYYADTDGDGYGNLQNSIASCIQPSGYVSNSTDCNDANALIHPGATEVCNGLDDDCNGQTDDGLPFVTYYADADGDGYGNVNLSVSTCDGAPSGYVSDATDCHDGNAAIHPNASEICNGIDDDCDGLIDDADPSISGQSVWYADTDGDGYGDPSIQTYACIMPMGYVANNSDCDDNNPLIHPNATEICNGIDDDCDGLIDDADPSVSGRPLWYADSDGDGYGNLQNSIASCIQPSGYVSNSTDCNDANPLIHPGATEVCNGLDDDCNGQTDDGLPFVTYYADTDGDGYGNVNVSVSTCDGAPSGYVSDATDCNDANNAVHPNATEICNGIDDDCDGLVDEGFVYSVAANSISSGSGTSFCEGLGTTLSVSGGQAGTGANWYWYESNCGTGVPIDSGSSIFVNPTFGTHTYYVRSAGTCNTSNCVQLDLQIHHEPLFNSCPSMLLLNTDPLQCHAQAYYNAAAILTPIPDYSYLMTGVTSGSGTGTGSGTIFEKGLTHIQIMASNTCGTDTCSFDAWVEDHEIPDAGICPADITVDAEPGQWGAHVNWNEPVASDNCPGFSMNSTHTPGQFFNVGNTLVHYQVMDASGNTNSCSFQVHVNPPGLIGGTNVSVFASDLHFSQSNPAPGSNVTVNVTVHNSSVIACAPFKCVLQDMLNSNYYPAIQVPPLNAGQDYVLSWVIGTPLTDALLPVKVVIDSDAEINESNELDNQAIRPLFVGNAFLSGHILVEAAANPYTSQANGQIQLCGQAHYTDLAIPIPDSSVAGAQVRIHIAETGEDLFGVTDVNGHFCIQYSTPVTAGWYHFNALVNDFTLQGDTDNQFLLTPIPPNTCHRDLSIRMELTADYLCNKEDHIAVGDPVNVHIEISNGCSPVLQPTTLALNGNFSLSTPVLINIPPLSAWQTYQIDIPNLQFNNPGAGVISATVDYYDSIPEYNEKNNTSTKILHVHPLLPDLIPGKSFLSSNYQCHTIQINNQIYNDGGIASVGATAILGIYKNNILIDTLMKWVGPVEAQCTMPVHFQYQAPVYGWYTFILYCDTPGNNLELNEANNSYATTEYIDSCTIDLIVDGCESMDIKPTDPSLPGILNLQAAIRNIGQSPVTDSFSVAFDVAGTLYHTMVYDPIPPSGSKVVQLSVPVPAFGNHQWIVAADAGMVIPEKNEFNNSKQGKLCWEFEPVNFKCNEMTPPLRGTISRCSDLPVRIGVYNHGFFEASHVEVLFEVSGPGLSGWVNLGTTTLFMDRTCDCPRIAELPGAFTFPLSGVYQVRVTVDPNSQYTECDELNNILIVPVQVTEDPDYAVYSQFIAPSEINPDINEPIQITVSYTNEGCSGIVSSELNTEIDAEPFDSVNAVPLQSGATFSYLMSGTWSSMIPGVHVIRASIDHDQSLNEADELNNEATRSIVVGAVPNFKVLTMHSSDYQPQNGEWIHLETTITNTGTTGAQSILQWYYTNDQHQEQLFATQPIQIAAGDTLSFSQDWAVQYNQATIIVRVIQSDPPEFNLTDNEASLQLNPMSVSLQSLSVSCFGNSDGQIQATVTGGQAPYYVEWSTGQTGNPVQVPAGTYTVTVTDINGLQATAVDSVTQPALLQAIENYLPIACYGDPVLIQVSATGGTPPYSGTGILNAFAGTQNITVIDTVGCTSVLNFFISQPDSLQVNEVHQDASCNNLQDAEINISVLGGTAPYSYSWSTSAVSQDIENIGEGTYGLNVTDDLGCTKAIQVQIQSMALATIWYVDQDGDGYGSPMQFVWSCLPPAGFVADSSDCNDLVATTHPGAGEICGNGIDDNCNGIVDEGCTQPCNLQVDIITTGPTTVCAPTCVMLHAQSTGAYGGVTYTWHSLTDVVPTVDACVSGWYKVSVSDSNACHASDSVYIEVHPQPSCTITPLAAVNYPVVNSNNNSLCATVFGATNYTWSLTSSNNSWYIQGSTHNLCVNYHCGSMASSATFTLLATSADGCVSSPCIYTLSPEAHEVCSYTQGFYGNSNGQLTCIGKTAACAVKQALGWNNACNAISACNPIVVGYGNTRKITIGCSEASCVTAKLPAGNTASVLPTGGPWNCSNVPSSLLQNGRFKNVLLGQTIALSINLRLFPALANLHITNSCFSTWQSADCDPNSNNVVANSMLNFSIPQSVINCLGSNPNNNKVGNLLNLANLALAGQPYGCAASGGGCGNSAPDLSDITAALDAINKGFDRCRIISGYNVRMNSSSGGDENLIFRYFPNPTNGETTIEFESPVDALAELQLLNMDGSKINTLFHQEVEAGESYTGSFNAGTLAPGLYLLRLKVGERTAFGKLVVGQ